MTLQADEFIRRFLQHVLPPGFARIRHYGLLSGRNNKRLLPLCRQLLTPPASCLPDPAEIARYQATAPAPDLSRCPHCRIGQMIRIQHFVPIPLLRSQPWDTS